MRSSKGRFGWKPKYKVQHTRVNILRPMIQIQAGDLLGQLDMNDLRLACRVSIRRMEQG